jgi:hypothetical protein
MTVGGQTLGGVVAVGVTLPVGVAVAVEVAVFVAVGGVDVVVAVAVGVEVVDVVVAVAVDVGVEVLGVSARLRKITIVWEAAVPSTILTRAVPALRFLLSSRSAGMV